ncbi:tail fiber protein [uncultured phage MedDCM-OCT-S46-C10]|uniref:Tail fiber n=1 Tax=uncultured phage MedDCM-OCT-S46-C10 TaxID=2741074 RepID=A0A6S4PD00_9CAUD|nr:tail fiber protein [uncultured phage_MedDCM-OCT-S46-C10]BAQ94337.1 tail fiber [uncultured phage_MedDCM-OCT-S46-C10]
MANSFVRYTGNGNTTAYSIPYSYRDPADLIVTINGVATTSYTLNSAGSTLTFDTAPANSSAIEIRRKTSQTSRLTDYAAGSVLTENDLDTDSTQAFFMSQEAIDDAGDVIKLSNTNFQWDTQNKRLTNVADPVNNTDGVNKQFISTNLPNITTVSGISSDVTTVAGIASNVTAVASDATDIGTVATNIASVNTVATDIAKVIVVANDLNETVSEIETAALDLQETTSEIDTVSNNIANVNTVGTNITNVNTVAGVSANVTTVAGINTDVTSVAGISSAVSAVNSNSTNINAVNANSANINTVAGIDSDITSVANISSDVAAVENIAANVTTVAGNNANITTVAGANSNITAVAGAITNVNNVGGAIANVNNVGGSIANVNTVATNLASVNNFAEQYRIASSAPTSSLNVGDLYFDTTANELKVYKSSGWAAAGSTVNGTSQRFTYTISGTPSSVTGSDANGNTLAYDAGFADVYLNGVRLSSADITITSGTSVVFASALANGDVVDVVAYGTFNVASINAANISSGTVNNARLTGSGAITINGSSVSLGGNITVGETKPTIGSISPSTITNAQTSITITGTNFVSVPQVEALNQSTGIWYTADTISFTNATTLVATFTLSVDAQYKLRIENPDGNAVLSSSNILTVSDAPTWSTSAGSLGVFAGNFSGTLATISASSDSTVAYSETTSVLTGAGVTLNTSTGALTTSDFGASSTTPTTYNFTIRATDGEGQTTDRSFSMTSSFGSTGGGQFN